MLKVARTILIDSLSRVVIENFNGSTISLILLPREDYEKLRGSANDVQRQLNEY